MLARIRRPYAFVRRDIALVAFLHIIQPQNFPDMSISQGDVSFLWILPGDISVM